MSNVTPEKLASIEKLHAGYDGRDMPLVMTYIPELVAEVRRLWAVRDMAREVANSATLQGYGINNVPSDAIEVLRDALAAYDQEAGK